MFIRYINEQPPTSLTEKRLAEALEIVSSSTTDLIVVRKRVRWLEKRERDKEELKEAKREADEEERSKGERTAAEAKTKGERAAAEERMKR